jgi:hypothetical protein
VDGQGSSLLKHADVSSLTWPPQSQIPWLLMSEILNFAAWFPLVFWTSKPTDPYHGGSFWFQDVLYFLWIGGFAQFVAICSPTAEAAALFNSIPLGLMASFSGVLLPYPQIPAWWRYWIYYLSELFLLPCVVTTRLLTWPSTRLPSPRPLVVHSGRKDLLCQLERRDTLQRQRIQRPATPCRPNMRSVPLGFPRHRRWIRRQPRRQCRLPVLRLRKRKRVSRNPEH